MQTVAARGQALAFPFPVVAKAVAADTCSRLPGRPIRLQRGEPIYREGAVAHDLYKVVSGTVRTCRILPDGRRMVTSFALAGEVFGLEGVGAHRVSAEAVTECVVIAFARKAIDDCVDREPVAAHSWQAFTLEMLSASEERCLLLGRKSAAERVATFLLDLAGRSLLETDVVELPMSRYDVADHLGLTAETVSRVLSGFRRRRLIADQGPHRLRLLNRDALEEQANDSGD